MLFFGHLDYFISVLIFWCCVPRVGVINVCSKNDLYYDPHDVIITSQMAVSELVDNDKDNDNKLPLDVPLVKYI